MKKKTLFILLISIVLVWTAAVLPAWAGNPQRHRWEGVAIGVGAAILGGALLHHAQPPRRNHSRPVYYQSYPQQQQVYVAPYCPPKPSGHWEWQKIWVPTVCEKTWNPGHYNRRNHWVPGHWIRINKQSGYWRKEKIWVSY
jgi:hypothetical protein